MANKTCIRQLADPEQIEGCKVGLSRLQPSFVAFSEVYALLGSEVRLKIIYLLGREKELCPCDLSDILDMTIPAVSQHLKKLKEGGLIDCRRDKQTIYYYLTDKGVETLQPVLAQMGVLNQQMETI